MFLREMTEELERTNLVPLRGAVCGLSGAAAAPWNPVRSEPAINGY